jgi:hypothetical protein
LFGIFVKGSSASSTGRIEIEVASVSLSSVMLSSSSESSTQKDSPEIRLTEYLRRRERVDYNSNINKRRMSAEGSSKRKW